MTELIHITEAAAAERFETRGVLKLSSTQPYAYFSKYPLRCSLAQAIFSVYCVRYRIVTMRHLAVVQAVLLHCAS